MGDMWFFPLLNFLTPSDEDVGGDSLRSVMSLLRLMRLLRILRLAKLMKAIKPLYRLLIGVVSSIKAMQWVMVMSFLMFYAFAILFTTIMGHGLIFVDGIVPEDASTAFGTVPASLFTLFRLMNDLDAGSISSVTTTGVGQVILGLFMVIASWAILAILTSVISDNMIATSQRMQDEEDVVEREQENILTERRLNMIFLEFDKRQTGRITEMDWEVIVDDVGLNREIMEASGADSVEELQTAFDDLCEEQEEEVDDTPEHANDPYVDGVHMRHKRTSTQGNLDALPVVAKKAVDPLLREVH